MSPSEDASQVEIQIEHNPKLLALIVDDDDDFRVSVAALAKREGFETCTAGTLEEARKSMIDAPPDLVLVDLRLPDGHGLDLLAGGIPASDTEFVVVTGNASVETAIHAIREGAIDYLTKPFDPMRLTGKVDGFGERMTALTVARSTEGVKSVIDDLQIEKKG